MQRDGICRSGDEGKKSAALRWLRGEWSTRTDARNALGVVRTIIDDSSIYDYLKLMAQFVRLAGYKGMLVVLDEMVNLYKLQSAQARSANYEQMRQLTRAIRRVLDADGLLHDSEFEWALEAQNELPKR